MMQYYRRHFVTMSGHIVTCRWSAGKCQIRAYMSIICQLSWVPTQATLSSILSLHNYLQIVGNLHLSAHMPCLASQRSSIRDNQLIVAYSPASFCLSTYSGNFLLDDQFLTFEAHSSLFSVFAPRSRLHVCTPSWRPILTSFEVKVYYRCWRKSSIFHKYRLFTKSGVLEIRGLALLFL